MLKIVLRFSIYSLIHIVIYYPYGISSDIHKVVATRLPSCGPEILKRGHEILRVGHDILSRGYDIINHYMCEKRDKQG